MMEINGISSSPGFAIAPAFIYRHDKLVIAHEYIADKNVDSEIDRFERVIKALVEEFEINLKGATTDSEKALYSVELLMLEDEEYHKAIKSLIKERLYSAEWAVEDATANIIKMISQIEDEYLKERIIDIRDVEYTILETLTGKRREHIVVGDKRIIVADYILTSELLALEGLENVLGVVLDTGGKTSHVAILCKSKNIPSVVGVGSYSLEEREGNTIIIDGDNGKVISSPTKKVRSLYEKRIKEREELLKGLNSTKENYGSTKDGHPLILDANIEWLEGVDDAISSGAENIGLFRTEFIAIRDDLVNERDKKDEIYMAAAEKMSGHGHIVFRTLDIGGDKRSDTISDEDNPILGWRAVRYMLSHKSEFKSQMAAILKASKFKNVRIMFPMISGIEELDECLALLEEAKSELRSKKIEFDENIKVGTMIEVPSAALTADILAKKVDFFSIGTNDLIQYTIAVDRGNSKTNYLYNPLHPGFLRLLKYVVDKAKEASIEVGLCGQMASEVEYLPLLVALGLDEISMSPPQIPVIKNALSQMNYTDCLSLLNEVLSKTNQSEIEKTVKEFLDERNIRY